LKDPDAVVQEALAGDEEAFARLIGPFRRELLVHCYRMLGSLQDAEDVLQEALLHAWRRLGTLRQPASFRAWLYKIATNACLDLLDERPRRTLPSAVYPAADPREAMAEPIDAPIWLEPLPDEWLAGAADHPEARYTMRESIALAFQLALQLLPPRRRAVLILRDVLAWQAKEVADLLDMTISAVNSALHRARATVRKYHGADRDAAVRSLPDDERTRRLLNEYVQAWGAADIAKLIALLKDDATWVMPPLATWYRGREAIHAFIVTRLLAARGVRGRYIATRANGQPAMAIYHRSDTNEVYQAVGLQVLTVDESVWQIAQVSTFMKPELFSRFDLAVELSE
jgi:RNA polymerase sigma-70 factor, ECF subfamily